MIWNNTWTQPYVWWSLHIAGTDACSDGSIPWVTFGEGCHSEGCVLFQNWNRCFRRDIEYDVGMWGSFFYHPFISISIGLTALIMIVNGINEWLMLINHSQCSTSGYFHPLNTKHHHSKATLEAAGDLLPATVEMMGDYTGDMKIPVIDSDCGYVSRSIWPWITFVI